MPKYRIDFSRLARTPDEIIKDKLTCDFLSSILTSYRAINAHDNFRNSLCDGHILDTFTVELNEYNLYGKDILDKYIKPKYPEAKLISWDSY